MKKVLILAVAIVMCASLVSAQTGGRIGLYSDSPGYSDCFLTAALYVPATIYVVHDLLPQANTSQFKVVHNWTADVIPGAVDFGTNLTLGNIFTGVTVTYVGCKALPHLLATMQFTALAVPADCVVQFTVEPDPGAASGNIVVVDCGNNELIGTGGKLVVNGNADDCPCEIIGTEPTNWSKVTALYQ
jgi:hypothetical protein